MKTLIKKLPVVAVVLALVGAFAFTVPDKAKDDPTYWFEYDGTTIGSYIGTDASMVCPDISGTHCALKFSESDVTVISEDEVELNSGVKRSDALQEAFKVN